VKTGRQKDGGSVLMCYVQCCKCKTFLDVKETSREEASVTHSLCPECLKETMAEVNAMDVPDVGE